MNIRLIKQVCREPGKQTLWRNKSYAADAKEGGLSIYLVGMHRLAFRRVIVKLRR